MQELIEISSIYMGWPWVTITINKADGSQGTFEARVDEPLLNSMERNGFTAENTCRSGECSLCRARALELIDNPTCSLRIHLNKPLS